MLRSKLPSLFSQVQNALKQRICGSVRFQHGSMLRDEPEDEFGRLLNGKETSEQIKNSIREEITGIRSDPRFAEFEPGLAIVQVGNRPDSNVYIKHKLKFAEHVGIKARHYQLPPTVTQDELEEQIDFLNSDSGTDGIIVQLPLETSENRFIDTDTVIDRILPEKDVDGLTRENAGRLARGELNGTVIPCTPRGCLHLVQKAGVAVEGKRVVVLGRSKIVGGPAAALFMWHQGTVTTCHSRTKNLMEECQRADILLVAIGKAQLVKKDWVKPGAVVIDCGINILKGAGPKGKNKLVGDVDFSEVRQVASHITPVPGGVGPMTVAMLLFNTLDQAKRRKLPFQMGL